MTATTHLRQSTGNGEGGSGIQPLYAQEGSLILCMTPLEKGWRRCITSLGVAKVEESSQVTCLQSPFLPASPMCGVCLYLTFAFSPALNSYLVDSPDTSNCSHYWLTPAYRLGYSYDRYDTWHV